MKIFQHLALVILCLTTISLRAADNEIEEQLQEIGKIPNEEIVVVQRKYTRKIMRHEFTPVMFGGMPFGTVRRTLFGGASYTLHINDWLGVDLLNFVYTKNFFSSFTDDINNASGTKLRPDYQKLLYFLHPGIQLTPIYGKMSSFSRWIAYVEPYFSLGVGIAKTESDMYLAAAPGVGVRIFFREWLSMRIDFKDYIYSEKSPNRDANGAIQSNLRNNYAVMASLSFWLPKMPR